MMEDTPALKVEGLSVNFDTTSVLWDIHFQIPQGMLVGIMAREKVPC
jgi:ABC-type transporter Mla maintaining outer membrane lipid asymmetry ATPase subunit MlaF